ncbi:Uncharacterised protein [Mycobacteroides abscessus subsp. abscessus]|nr:Uncharacterised protein [Mycobacteroides abscessus subsp. abscessus]
MGIEVNDGKTETIQQAPEISGGDGRDRGRIADNELQA